MMERLPCHVGWRNHSTLLTMRWLDASYTPREGACIARNDLYRQYVEWCNWNLMRPVIAASFGKIISKKFPHLTTRRLGTRGQSKYHYYGLALRHRHQEDLYHSYKDVTDDSGFQNKLGQKDVFASDTPAVPGSSETSKDLATVTESTWWQQDSESTFVYRNDSNIRGGDMIPDNNHCRYNNLAEVTPGMSQLTSTCEQQVLETVVGAADMQQHLYFPFSYVETSSGGSGNNSSYQCWDVM